MLFEVLMISNLEAFHAVVTISAHHSFMVLIIFRLYYDVALSKIRSFQPVRLSLILQAWIIQKS
jgi:hypothetical protein